MLLCLTILFIRQISAKAQEKETMMKVKEVFNMIERVLGVPVDQIELQMKFTDPEGKVLEKSSVTLHYNQVERTFQPEKPGLVIVELDRALIAAKFAQHRPRNIDAAKLLDPVIGDAVLKDVAPGVGKRPERRRHVRANGLAFRARCPFSRAAFEFGDHGRILNR